MRGASLLVAAALSAIVGRPTWAQGVAASDRDAQIYLAEFADCVVAQKGYRAKVSTFLRTIPDSPTFVPAAFKAADLHCLDAAARRSRSKIEMRLQPATFRSALYPALYKRDFGSSGPIAGIGAVAPMQLPAEFDGSTDVLTDEYRTLRLIGDCVSRASPTGAHELLTATPFDKREDAAVGQLRPALASCLASGQTIRINRAALRSTVGEAMYKLSQAASAHSG